MSVDSLLEQNLPQSIMSEERSNELFEFIKERFREKADSPIEQHKEAILGRRPVGRESLAQQEDDGVLHHVLLGQLQRPDTDTPPAHIRGGQDAVAAPDCYDDHRGRVPEQATGAQGLGRCPVAPLPSLVPSVGVVYGQQLPATAKLWVFQTLLLLELYEKMFSTRELHERAHIHHATTITLMRRGRSLIANQRRIRLPTRVATRNIARGSRLRRGRPTLRTNGGITGSRTRRRDAPRMRPS